MSRRGRGGDGDSPHAGGQWCVGLLPAASEQRRTPIMGQGQVAHRAGPGRAPISKFKMAQSGPSISKI